MFGKTSVHNQPVITLSADDFHIVARIPFEYKELAKTVPGYMFDEKLKVWRYPQSYYAAKALAAIKRTYGGKWDDGFVQLCHRLKQRQDKLQLIKTCEITTLDPVPTTLRTPGWWQLRAYHFATESGSALLSMKMRTGKTKVAIDVLSNNGSQRVLILCPDNVTLVWRNEIPKDSATPLKIICPRGSTKKKLDAWKSFTEGIFITNYEICQNQEFRQAIYNSRPDFVIFDESHRIKGGRRSIVGKFALELGQRVKRKLLLTGTPMPHSPLDIWCQGKVIDKSIFGSVSDFIKAYGQEISVGNRGRKVIFPPAKMLELNKVIESFSYSVDSSVLELDEPIELRRYYRLSPQVEHTYRLVKDSLTLDLRAYKADKNVESLKASVVKINKLRQICSGFVKQEDEVTRLHKTKATLLLDVLDEIQSEEIQKHLVVFYYYQESKDILYDTLQDFGLPICELSGQRKIDAKSGGYLDWKQHGGILLVQVNAGALGNDLTDAAFFVVYEQDQKAGDMEQVMRRGWGRGQKQAPTYIYLLAEPPCKIESQIYDSNQKKQALQDFLLQSLPESSP